MGVRWGRSAREHLEPSELLTIRVSGEEEVRFLGALRESYGEHVGMWRPRAIPCEDLASRLELCPQLWVDRQRVIVLLIEERRANESKGAPVPIRREATLGLLGEPAEHEHWREGCRPLPPSPPLSPCSQTAPPHARPPAQTRGRSARRRGRRRRSSRLSHAASGSCSRSDSSSRPRR